MQGARAPQPGATNRPSPSGHVKGPSAPDRSQARPSSSAVRPPGRPERLPAPSQPAPQRPPGAGGPGGRGTPGPMPNPEVKPASAEGTAGATLWETRAPPAPGARCAGRGRGGAEEAPGRGGDPRGPPPLRLRGFYPHTGRGCRLSFSLRVRFRPRKAAGTAAGIRLPGGLRALLASAHSRLRDALLSFDWHRHTLSQAIARTADALSQLGMRAAVRRRVALKIDGNLSQGVQFCC